MWITTVNNTDAFEAVVELRWRIREYRDVILSLEHPAKIHMLNNLNQDEQTLIQLHEYFLDVVKSDTSINHYE